MKKGTKLVLAYTGGTLAAFAALATWYCAKIYREIAPTLDSPVVSGDLTLTYAMGGDKNFLVMHNNDGISIFCESQRDPGFDRPVQIIEGGLFSHYTGIFEPHAGAAESDPARSSSTLSHRADLSTLVTKISTPDSQTEITRSLDLKTGVLLIQRETTHTDGQQDRSINFDYNPSPIKEFLQEAPAALSLECKQTAAVYNEALAKRRLARTISDLLKTLGFGSK